MNLGYLSAAPGGAQVSFFLIFWFNLGRKSAVARKGEQVMFWYLLFGWVLPDTYVMDRCLEGVSHFAYLLDWAKDQRFILNREDIRAAKDWMRWEKRAVERGYIPVAAENYHDHLEEHGYCLLEFDGPIEPQTYALPFWNTHRLWESKPCLYPGVATGEPFSRETAQQGAEFSVPKR
ncbi:MAG: hypothetical protein A2571_02280 [Candidatus Vogelbacteria bacterium RIFOXYD1_FULL_44_32]|uniref:Uncharacterized protein n=1 Tax=Candidatus Vogelbacteria bacterium RIFOXYD1_FULL_44_32 TaxID=1802438 RepID=A0A1G2QDE7_9BACT|nr:MAG: hypothetical protein A2571_02280 [Candidatus Vogelbacteria bacterium RIFOXYD1_FULL_44_32]